MKHSEEIYALLSEANVNEQLLHCSRDAFLILENLKIIFANNNWQQMCGSGADNINESFIFYFPTSEKDTIKNVLTGLTDQNPESELFESTLMKDDESRIDVEIVISKLKIEKRDLFCVNLRDISSLKKIATSVRQTQTLESIGTLAAGIAHEINTPTQYVGDNISFLTEAFQDFQELFEKYEALLHSDKIDASAISSELEEINESREYMDIEFICEEIPRALEQSQEGIVQVTQIVRAMRDFAHPIQDEMVPTDFNKLVKNTVIVAKNEWKYHSNIEYKLDDSLPMIICNPGEIGQVLLNLLINSAHAITQKREAEEGDFGLISLKSSQDESHLFFEISDSGNGIPDNVKERIFDPFFTTKEVGMGTGQGLAITFNVIVENHQGTISFESEEGKGTTFKIKLPFNCAREKDE